MFETFKGSTTKESTVPIEKVAQSFEVSTFQECPRSKPVQEVLETCWKSEVMLVGLIPNSLLHAEEWKTQI